MKNPTNDTVHGLVGQYKVYPRVEKLVYTGNKAIVLPEEVVVKLRDIDAFFYKRTREWFHENFFVYFKKKMGVSLLFEIYNNII